jgi:hypothetical protein
MAQEFETIDLTTTSKSLLTLTDKDVIILVATGGIGFLVKKLVEAVFHSSASSTVDQLEALRKLIRDCKETNVKKISAKISQPAFASFKASAKDLKIDIVQEYQDACVFTVEFS